MEAEALKVIAENYGLPGMVLIVVALFLFGIPRIIKAIQGLIESAKGDSGDKSIEKPGEKISHGPGPGTRQWTQDEVRRASDDAEKILDLKLVPILQKLATLQGEIEENKGKDSERDDKYDKLLKRVNEIATIVTQLHTAAKINSGEGSGLTKD